MDKVHLTATKVEEMSANEAVAIIGHAGIAALRQRFTNPVIHRYITAHEGVSRGKMGEVAAKAKRWFRNAIDGVARRMNPNARTEPVPVKLGIKHNPDNRVVGEVVGSRLVAGSEGVQAEALVVYTDEKLNDNPPDLCSIEADVLVSELGGESGVEGVCDVTGLAVGYSALGVMTGFQRSTIVETIHCFVDDSTGGIVMIEDVKKALKSGELTINELMALPGVVTQLEKAGAPDKENRKLLEAEQTANSNLRSDLANSTATINELTNKVEGLEAKETTREWTGKNPEHLDAWFIAEKINLDDNGKSTVKKWMKGFIPKGTTEEEWNASLIDAAKVEVAKFEDITKTNGGGSPPIPVSTQDSTDNAADNNSGVNLSTAPTPLQGVVDAGARAGVAVTIQQPRG